MIFRIVWFLLSAGLVAFAAVNWFNEEHNREHISSLIYAPLGVIGIASIIVIISLEESAEKARANAKWQAKKVDSQ